MCQNLEDQAEKAGEGIAAKAMVHRNKNPDEASRDGNAEPAVICVRA